MEPRAWKIMVTSLAVFRSGNCSMTDKIVVLSTCATGDEAERLARLLLDERLAACVSVIPAVRSFYHWKGAIESAGECLLLIKTSRKLFADLCETLRKAHSYELPE